MKPNNNCSTVIEADFQMINSFDTWHGKCSHALLTSQYTKVPKMWQNL